MDSFLDQLVNEMQSPDISSSIGPLIVVVSVFLIVSLALIYWVLKMLRVPQLDESEPSLEEKNHVLTYLNAGERLRNFWRFSFGDSQRNQGDDHRAELEELRKKVARLEQENSSLRDLHARAVTRLDEIKNAMRVNEEKNSEMSTALEKAQVHRSKLQKRNEELETQLNELMGEVEKTYRAKMQSSGSDVVKNPPFFQNTISLETARKLEEKDAQIRQLKELLMVCRSQIEAFTAQNRPPQQTKQRA